MASLDNLREDLDYVAGAVRRDDVTSVPIILVLWGVLIPVGFALADFAPRWCGLYWLVASIAGGCATALISKRTMRLRGQVDRELGRRHGLHWLVMGAAFVLFGASLATGHMDVRSTVPIWLLLSGMGYTLAGLHLDRDRALLPSGLIMFGGYAALVWLPLPYVWTTTGLIASASLLTAAVRSAHAARSA
jgi:hypothetical protein